MVTDENNGSQHETAIQQLEEKTACSSRGNVGPGRAEGHYHQERERLFLQGRLRFRVRSPDLRQLQGRELATKHNPDHPRGHTRCLAPFIFI